jgi:phosphoadenosine phosphosulfate reductase
MQQMMITGETELEYRIKTAIDRLQAFEPEEGYYLAFSGGKDSQCIYHLAKEAGVKFDAHYNVTGIDPPELVYFIRKQYPDVKRDMYEKSMWRLIEQNGPPTSLQRFCCKNLKERGGEGRVCVTGVRWAESTRRAKTRNVAEYMGKTMKEKVLFNDNSEMRRMMENCSVKGKYILNPIIDWSESNVWDYIKSRNLKYCSLYDKGEKRLGCIGCPMSGGKGIKKDFRKYPKFKKLYLKAFEKFLTRRKNKGNPAPWNTAEDLMEWWLQEESKKGSMIGQKMMF